MRLVALAALLLMSSTLGCGIDASSDVAPTTADELNTSSKKVFDCHGGAAEDSINHWELTIANKKATIVDLSKDAYAPDDGTLDSSYAPTSATYRDTSRYLGFDKLVGGDVTKVDLMVSKDVQNGASGKAWLRFSGPEGGNTVSFRCEKKTKAIAVDTAKHARLSCSVSPIACWHDNPPGDTCFAELFVNQKEDDAADLKLSWMDHFGVHVQSRSEQVGTSSTFDRSKTKIKAKWAQTELTIEYRAGITYTGALERSGQTRAVQCNDLAMLDD